MGAWIRTAFLGCLIFTLACAGEDDGDGGALLTNEEERVCAWIDQISPLVDEVGNLDAMGFGSSTISNPAELSDLRRRVDQASPPSIQHLQANRVMREFQEALADRIDAVIECAEELARMNVASMILGNTDLDDAVADVEEAGNRIDSRARDISELITRDLEDHQQSMFALQDMVGAVGQYFGEAGFAGMSFGGEQRELPSQMTSGGSTTGQYQRFIPPSIIPTS